MSTNLMSWRARARWVCSASTRRCPSSATRCRHAGRRARRHNWVLAEHTQRARARQLIEGVAELRRAGLA
ncbi:MAG: hypothetical protein EBZ76_07800 [Synechococcaceae bacterium WB9_2_170]|nr:hypothetical protein [Synechococcaceae bacterium WB9_2_170]